MSQEYNIQAAAKLTGLTDHVLRAWEKRYKIIEPKRNKAGHRVYLEEDIYKLKLLNKLCQEGQSISSLTNKKVKDLEIMCAKLNIDYKNLNQVADNPEKAKELLTYLLMALEAYKLDAISHQMSQLPEILSKRDLSLGIVAPLIRP